MTLVAVHLLKAIFYREHPELATILDIANTSHRAGMEGAKYGAIIGGTISVLKSTFAMAQKKVSLGDAAVEVAEIRPPSGARLVCPIFATQQRTPA